MLMGSTTELAIHVVVLGEGHTQVQHRELVRTLRCHQPGRMPTLCPLGDRPGRNLPLGWGFSSSHPSVEPALPRLLLRTINGCPLTSLPKGRPVGPSLPGK